MRWATNKRLLVAGLLAAGLLTQGCAVRRWAVRSATEPIIDGGFTSMMAEEDLVLAKTALESNLKLVEGLLVSDPGNTRLLLLASQGFTAYSLGFVEDDDPDRAVRLYLRGREYANRWLEDRYDVDLLAIERLDDFDSTVAKLPADAVPGVFWLANSWASQLLLSLNDISSISNLPRVETLMRFVLKNDETYYFAGAHLFFGAYYGARSTFLGGDPAKARTHLARQQELTHSQMLLGDVFKVKYVDMPALDEDAARTDLKHVLNADIDALPSDMRLMNRVAQAKAKRLMDHIDDYF